LFFLRLKTNLETITARFKAKNELTELSDEDNENLNKIHQTAEALCAQVDEIVNSNQYTTCYDIDVCIGQWTTLEKVTLERVRQIFAKRVMLVRNLSENADNKDLCQQVGFLSAKYGYQIFDVQSMMDELKPTMAAGSTCVDQTKILDYIKTKVNSDKCMNRNIVLFDVLQADKKDTQNYPNSIDEIFMLMHNVGTLRSCFDFVDCEQKIEVEESWEEKEVKEEVVKAVPKDGEEEEDAPPPADEEEEGKKKFDPSQFEWHRIEGPAKTFANIYNQMHNTEKIQMNYNNFDMHGLEAQFREVNDTLEEGHDKYYYIQAFVKL